MSRIAAIAVILTSLLSLSAAQDAPFTVTRPGPGDTLILSQDSSANELYIDWTVPPGTEDQPVLITLQRGENVESLETIETVNATANNSGSYTWDGSDSVSLQSGTDPSLARTACNYTVRLSVDGLVAYSQYFTIINEVDGPVPESETCPIEDGVARPQFANAEANSTVLGSEAASTSNSGNGSGGSGGGGGISTSTLAVAIVIPIVVLLLIFGLLLWFGIRRGWFAKLSERRGRGRNAHATHENTAGFGETSYPHGTPMSPASVGMAEKKEEMPAPAYAPQQPMELHSEHRAWEAEGREVYQLEGDERDARFGDGNVRGT